MVSEKQTPIDSRNEDPFPFTTLRENMEADGFPEEIISMLITTHQDNPAAARGAYELMRETKVRQGELSAERDAPPDRQEAAVPMHVHETMGARAVGDTSVWRISGTLDDDEPKPVKTPQAASYQIPPQTSTEGMDLSAEGIKAWIQQNRNH